MVGKAAKYRRRVCRQIGIRRDRQPETGAMGKQR
jgi:hypothetical protein